jgi:ribosomal protein S8
MSKNYSGNSFGGYYIVSTPKGLMTSGDSLIGGGFLSGEVLLKIYV